MSIVLESIGNGTFQSGRVRPRLWRPIETKSYSEVEPAALVQLVRDGWSGTLYGAWLWNVVLTLRCLLSSDLDLEDMELASSNSIFLHHTETYDHVIQDRLRAQGVDVENSLRDFSLVYGLPECALLRDVASKVTSIPDVRDLMNSQRKKGSLASRSLIHKIDEQQAVLKSLGFYGDQLNLAWNAMNWYTSHIGLREIKKGRFVGSSVHSFDIVGMLRDSRKLEIRAHLDRIGKVLNIIIEGQIKIMADLEKRGLISKNKNDGRGKLELADLCAMLVHEASSIDKLVSDILELCDIISPDLWVDMHNEEGLHAGFADLMIWKSGCYRLVEVKSPNDKIRHTQTRYINNQVAKFDLPFYICNIVDSTKHS